MSDSAPSPTPSEDNRKNVRDDLMQNALENFMSRAPQSYDDFVDSFSTLKQCKPALVPSLAERKLAGHTPAPTGLTDQTEPSDDGPVKSTRNIVNDIKRRRLGKVIVGRKPEEDKGEEIEEQVLSEGNVSCRLGKSNVIRTGAVKVDNFVDEDDLVELTPEYSASFSSGKRRSDKEKQVSFTPPSSKSSNTVQQTISNKQSTDDLLMNFMADLQKELSTNENQHSQNTVSLNKTLAPTIQSPSNMDIQTFIDKQHRENQKMGDKGNKVDQSDETEEVDFDDDDCDAALELCDDQNSQDLKIHINAEDLEHVAQNEISEDARHKLKLSEIYKNALMDSEGNVMTTMADMMSREGADTDVDARGDNLIFPGQVEEEKKVATQITQTQLKFRATYKHQEDTSTAEQEDQDNTAGTVIEPFQLDADYDYDNVVLTAKFSPGDILDIKLKQRQAVCS